MGNEITKVLICDDSVEFGKACAKEFGSMGMQVKMYCQNDKTVLESIWDEKPDVVVLDVDVFGAEAMTVIHCAEAMRVQPAFIITSVLEDSNNETFWMENGAACFMVKPFGILSLYHEIERVIAEKRIGQNRELEMALTNLLYQLGFPASLKGYAYLYTAIQLAVADGTMLDNRIQELYSLVAAQYHATAIRVERTIRHAIELAWCRGDADVIQEIFSCTVDDSNAKPTNSKFIDLVAVKVRLEFGNESK